MSSFVARFGHSKVRAVGLSLVELSKRGANRSDVEKTT